METKVCRICLNTDVKMFQNNILDFAYMKLLNLNDPDMKSKLPQHICYECAALLLKTVRFKDKCMISYKLLQTCILDNQISYDKVLDIDRSKYKLKSSIKYIETNHNSKIILLKVDSGDDNDDISVKFEQSINHQLTGVPEHVKIEFCGNSTNVEQSNEPENVKTELFEHNSENEYDESIFEDDLQRTINIEPLKPIVPEELDLKKDCKICNRTTRRNPRRAIKDENQASKGKTRKRKVQSEPSSKPKRGRVSKKETNSNESHKRKKSEPKEKPKKKTNEPYEYSKLDENKWKILHFTDEEADKKFKERVNGSLYKCAPYKCESCIKGFSHENIFNSHVKKSHNEAKGNIMCQFCKSRFKRPCQLRAHLKLHYYEYHCLRCDFICTTHAGARFHSDMHDGKTHTCKSCNETFMHLSTYYTHMRTIHRSVHVCGICGESFVSESGLRTHKGITHQIYSERKRKTPRPTKAETKVENLEDSKYCKVCKISFETEEAYNRHLLSAANHAGADPEGQSTLELDEPEKKIEDDVRPYKTYRLYRRRYRNSARGPVEVVMKSSMPRNMRRTKKKPTTCEHCGQTFESSQACAVHYRAAHHIRYYTQKRTVCEVCGKDIQAGHWKIHMNTHTKNIQYTCNICSRVFYVKAILERHMLTHTGEKPYQCKLCDKRYQQSAGLILHERTIHQGQKWPPRQRKKTTMPNLFETEVQESTSTWKYLK